MRYALTDNKAREKGIDPPHDQRLGNHHGHVAFHHAHHALHGRRITHWIGSRLAPQFWLSQKLALLVGLDHVRLARSEGGWREHISVGAKVDAADEGAVLPGLGQVDFLGRGLEKRHCVMAEDACENLGMPSVQ